MHFFFSGNFACSMMRMVVESESKSPAAMRLHWNVCMKRHPSSSSLPLFFACIRSIFKGILMVSPLFRFLTNAKFSPIPPWAAGGKAQLNILMPWVHKWSLLSLPLFSTGNLHTFSMISMLMFCRFRLWMGNEWGTREVEEGGARRCDDASPAHERCSSFGSLLFMSDDHQPASPSFFLNHPHYFSFISNFTHSST